MKKTFEQYMLKKMSVDNKIILLIADDMSQELTEIEKKFPDRFVKVGIAECNLVGMAVGFARVGFKPVVYTYGCFLTYRAYEFVRDDVCINSLNIKMVGVGSGVKVNTFGPSHHTTEDIALLRSMPNLTLLCPASVKELPEVIESGLNFEGPVYIRIGRAFETEVFEEKVPKFEIGKSNLISEGKDLTIISTGNIIANAIEASNRLKSENVSCDIINLSSIKPLDSELILKSINKTHKVLTLEEHQKTGGIGSAIAEIIAENNLDCSFKRMGFDDKFAYEYGWHKDILEANGLSSDCVYKTIKQNFFN
ncbi:MAG: transketolase C-terminal domain-containing protein [Treponema sp.]|nr:transketolase C-terminal domain-containing protein [Treponema sp.]